MGKAWKHQNLRAGTQHKPSLFPPVWSGWFKSLEQAAGFSVALIKFKHKNLNFNDSRVWPRCLRGARSLTVTESSESKALFSSLELLAPLRTGKEQLCKGECAGVEGSLTELVRTSTVTRTMFHQGGRVYGTNLHLQELLAE